MNKSMTRRLNASGLTVKDRANYSGWHNIGVKDFTTRQRKRLENKKCTK